MKRNDDFFTDEYEGESRREYHRPVRRPKKKNYRLRRFILFAVIDILLIGIGLIVFALFHHVIPKKGGENAIALPTPSKTEVVAQHTPDSQPQQTPEQEEQPDEAEQETPTPAVDQGMWGAKFADKFTDGEVIQTENSYQSEDINVTVTKVEENSATYFIADIYVRNLENFKTMLAQDTFGTGFTEETAQMAKNGNAIIAISGDNYGARDFGIVIRNGVLYRDNLFEDVLIMNNDGSMETFSPDDFDINTVLENGAWQGWSFGPLLLTDGQPMETFNSNVNPRNPRSAIGYFEPGHYCFVVVDGRQPGYSDGLSLKDMSQLFYDLGCKVAYNLDGGQTAIMAFMGEENSVPYNGGRKTSDILYIAENEG